MRTMLRGKIHRATVTGADLHYEGSVTIDSDLLERADILPYQHVDIWNITNGERFQTYAMPGQRGSGVLCINGAAAHKARKGDLVIIASFGVMTEAEAHDCAPRLVFVDAHNKPKELRAEHAGQAEVPNAWH
jgi:aspartate 1-decarboxylase